MNYTENGVRLNLTDGLWNTVSAMPTYRVDGKIRQIEAVLTTVPFGMESGW